jgi:hypothetical protein
MVIYMTFKRVNIRWIELKSILTSSKTKANWTKTRFTSKSVDTFIMNNDLKKL